MDFKLQLDGVVDKLTNPQIHYCPENDFLISFNSNGKMSF